MITLYYWIMVITLISIITILSHIPNLVFFDEILPPEVSFWFSHHSLKWGTNGFFSYSISFHPDNILHKLGHIFLFGFLGTALYWAMGKSIAKSLLIVSIFALFDELHQGFTVGRSSRFGDVVLDVFAAVGFILLSINLTKKKRGCVKTSP